MSKPRVYPLYDTLCPKEDAKKLSKPKQTQLAEWLNDTTPQEAEAIMLLIAEDFRRSDGTISAKPPYEGVECDGKTAFDTSKLPPTLGRMLYEFMVKRRVDENERS